MNFIKRFRSNLSDKRNRKLYERGILFVKHFYIYFKLNEHSVTNSLYNEFRLIYSLKGYPKEIKKYITDATYVLITKTKVIATPDKSFSNKYVLEGIRAGMNFFGISVIRIEGPELIMETADFIENRNYAHSIYNYNYYKKLYDNKPLVRSHEEIPYITLLKEFLIGERDFLWLSTQVTSYGVVNGLFDEDDPCNSYVHISLSIKPNEFLPSSIREIAKQATTIDYQDINVSYLNENTSAWHMGFHNVAVRGSQMHMCITEEGEFRYAIVDQMDSLTYEQLKNESK